MTRPKNPTKTKLNPGSVEFTIQADAAWKRTLPGLEGWAVRVAEAAFHSANRSKLKAPIGCCIRFASDAEVKELNHDFRGKPKPTNVLSFPALEWKDGKLLSKSAVQDWLGDIILARGVVLAECKAQKKTIKQHVTHLIVHGVLHLLGYDHMHAKQALSMERLEVGILEKFGVNDPYEQ